MNGLLGERRFACLFYQYTTFLVTLLFSLRPNTVVYIIFMSYGLIDSSHSRSVDCPNTTIRTMTVIF